MRRPLKILSIAAGSLLALLVLAALGLEYYARTDSFHARIQAAASRGMGMEVELRGNLSFGLFPSPHLTLRDVHIRNRGVEMGSVEQVKVRYRLLPLLQRIPEILTLRLEHPRILITKGTDGVLDLIRSMPPVHKRAHGPMEVIASDGVIRYEGATSGAWAEADGCEMKTQDLRTEAPDGRRGIERLSFTGGLACKDVRAQKFSATDLEAQVVAAGKGVYALQPVTLRVFGVQAAGSLHADLQAGKDSYEATLSAQGLDVARVLKDLGVRQLGEGRVDLAADLSFQGHDRAALTRSAAGSISVHGRELKLEGYDVDGILKRFERSQHFDLLDAGALFAAGPLGLVATKGLDFARIKGAGGGTSPIHVLVSDWKVEKGVAKAQDVAASTDTHRMAMQGGLDFNTETFAEAVVAVVDAQGCVIARQELQGSFKQPQLKKPGIFHTLAGPVRRLVNKGENALTQKGCKAFYDGSVRPY